jgi:hypothetical protein
MSEEKEYYKQELYRLEAIDTLCNNDRLRYFLITAMLADIKEYVTNIKDSRHLDKVVDHTKELYMSVLYSETTLSSSVLDESTDSFDYDQRKWKENYKKFVNPPNTPNKPNLPKTEEVKKEITEERKEDANIIDEFHNTGKWASAFSDSSDDKDSIPELEDISKNQ